MANKTQIHIEISPTLKHKLIVKLAENKLTQKEWLEWQIGKYLSGGFADLEKE